MASNSSGSSDRPENISASAAHFASEVKNRAQDVVSAVAEEAEQVASNLGERGQEVAANIGQKAKNVASGVAQRAENAKSSVGGELKSLAGSIRQKAPETGMTGRAASAVAEGLDSSGSYLQQHTLGDMGHDMTNLIRRHPIPALLVGIGLGFLLARAVRS